MTNCFAAYDRSTPIHAYLELYMRRMDPVIRDFDWLWTDIEVVGRPPSGDIDDCGRLWLSGSQLLDYIYDGPQLIWTVLTAIWPHNRKAAVVDRTVPFARGNPICWSPSRGPQHSFGCVEIVCYDSYAVLLIGGDTFSVDVFLKTFPNAGPIQFLAEG